MELKPRPIELPSRKENQRKKNVIFEQNKTIQKEQTSQSYKRSNELHNETEHAFNRFVRSIFGLIVSLIFVGAFVVYFVYPIYINTEKTFDFQTILESDTPFIIGSLIFGLSCLYMLISSIIEFIGALIGLIKNKNQKSYFRENPIHQVVSQSPDDESENKDLGIYVNGRRLTPQEAKVFVEKTKKVINIVFYIITFFILLAVFSGGILGGLISFAIFFFIRKQLFNLFDKAVSGTIKEYAKNRAQFQQKESEQEIGWMEPDGKRAKPEDLKKGVIFLNVFICVCFLIFFSDFNIPALMVGLLLILLRSSMVKQIKEDEAKSAQEDNNIKENSK